MKLPYLGIIIRICLTKKGGLTRLMTDNSKKVETFHFG